MNLKGHAQTLVAPQMGNTNGLRAGVYSRRTLTPRAEEVREALLAAPFATDIDRIGAEEIGSLTATLEAIDRALADAWDRGRNRKDGAPVRLLEEKNRLSGRLLRWLREYGATPASRLELAERLGSTNAVQEAPASLEQGLRLLEVARERGDLSDAGRSE